MPKQTFKDKMTLGKGADQIDLYYFGRGHTNGDALVVFPALRTMHAGDIFAGKNLPLIDTNNGGSAVDIGRLAAEGARRHQERRHDHHRPPQTTMTWQDLQDYAKFNKEFVDVGRGRDEGRQERRRGSGRRLQGA